MVSEGSTSKQARYHALMTSIYLDHHATTPLLPEAWAAMQPLMAENFGNPSSAHHAGRKARKQLEDARETVARLLGADPDEVIFTSGATEANNLAIFGLVQSEHKPSHLLAAPIEHPCVIEPLKHLEAHGCRIDWLPVTASGHVETTSVLERIRDDTRLIAIMLANHETGAIQPVRHVAKTRPKQIPMHCDAAQAVGRIPVNFHDLDVTTLTASGHKFRGPKGIGLLLVKRGTKLAPRMFGGHQQQGRRPGTEPVALAVGLAVALEHAIEHLEENRIKLHTLRSLFLDTLRRSAGDRPVILNGPEIGAENGLPSVLNLSFPGCRADILLVSLDLAGIACSTGSACSSGSLLSSPVLQAMGVPEEVLRSALRFSFSASQSEHDVVQAAERVSQLIQPARK
jgi:cysteine desulfurase